jgi:hypothetical protein
MESKREERKALEDYKENNDEAARIKSWENIEIRKDSRGKESYLASEGSRILLH